MVARRVDARQQARMEMARRLGLEGMGWLGGTVDWRVEGVCTEVIDSGGIVPLTEVSGRRCLPSRAIVGKQWKCNINDRREKFPKPDRLPCSHSSTKLQESL